MQHRHLAAAICIIGALAAGCGTGKNGPAAPSAAGKGRPATGGLTRLGGSSAPADASLAGIHACKLIAPATVKLVIGRLFRPPYQTGQSCFYEPAVPGGAGPEVILTVMTRTGYEAARAFEQGASASGAIKFQTVGGLGDSAYATADTGGPEYELSVASGGRAISISVNSTQSADEHRVMELMQDALAHL